MSEQAEEYQDQHEAVTRNPFAGPGMELILISPSKNDPFATPGMESIPLPSLEHGPSAVPGTEEIDNSFNIPDIDDPFLFVLNRTLCQICDRRQPGAQFPQRVPTSNCEHESEVCLHCLQTHISTSMAQKKWDQIECPTCSERLGFFDMKAFAAAATFEK